jgi:Ca2+-transporting ATPase
VVHNWWRLPLKSLVLFGLTAGAVLLGMVVPVLTRIAERRLFPVHDFGSWVYGLGSFFIPLVVVFFGLSLFYRLAPRRPTRFAEVWAAALCATILLRVVESLFVIYLKDFATLNALYGAFGGIMALLLWIYLSGCVFIFGACLCAARYEASMKGPRNHALKARA